MKMNEYVFKAFELFERKDIIAKVHEFEKRQWLPASAIQEYQVQKLRELTKHAYDTVPFYTEKFDLYGVHPNDIHDISDMKKLPIITKVDIKANMDRMISSKYDRKHLFLDATGGSTGQPMAFYRTRDQRDYCTAVAFKNFRMVGWDFLVPTILLAGAPIDISKHQRFLRKIKNRLKREIVVPMFGLSEMDLELLHEKIRKVHPKVIIGYVSALYLFARWLSHKGYDDIRLPIIIQTAERVEEFQKEAIEEAFHGTFYKHYGSREMIGSGIECLNRTGLHANCDTEIIEILRGNMDVQGEEVGEVVLTDLYSYAMPLIRYNIGDVGKRFQGQCPCGRNSWRFDVTEGRMPEIITTSDGKFISAVFFPHLFKEVSDFVKRFQVVQKTRRRLEIKIVRQPNYSQATEDYLRSHILKRTGDQTILQFDYVDDISVEESGKYTWTKSEVPVDFGNH